MTNDFLMRINKFQVAGVLIDKSLIFFRLHLR
jgi:hypothetical protein